jgi:hypothetical protein
MNDMLVPVPKYFTARFPEMRLKETFESISEVVGRKVGTLPLSREEAFIEAVFGPLFYLFNLKIILLSRGFKMTELTDCKLYWNEALHAGYLDQGANSRWILPLKRVK